MFGYPSESDFTLATRMVMQLAIGTMQEFSTDSESITPYLERLQLFFDCNGIAKQKRVSTLRTVIGHKTFLFLRNLLAPAELKDQRCYATCNSNYT